jgi:hypothetical protein
MNNVYTHVTITAAYLEKLRALAATAERSMARELQYLIDKEIASERKVRNDIK